MKAQDFPRPLYRNIRRHFGGYARAKRELDIKSAERAKGSGLKRKYSMEDIIKETRLAVTKTEDLSEFHANFRHLLDYGRNHLGKQDAIFELAGVAKPPIKRRTHTPKTWTKERIKDELEAAVLATGTTTMNQLNSVGYSRLTNAVKRTYGTWNAGLVALGYEVAHEFISADDNLTKKQTIDAVHDALAKGVRPVYSDLTDAIPKLPIAIRNHFEGIDELKEACAFTPLADRHKYVETPKQDIIYRPNLRTPEGVRRELLRLWYTGTPMSYKFMRKRRKHLISAANEHIGSWRKAVESIGVSYDEVSKTNNVLSECGTEFEEIFAEILTELKYEYIREGEGIADDFALKPDFILPNWRWIDCKLSEWTDVREMLIRYHDEQPNGITVVYLRGRNRRVERGRDWKYEHVSVYQFTEQLPQERRIYYEDKLRKIEEKADKESAVAT